MSFWKTFGKINLGILKTVGKAAGNVVGSYVGVQGLGNAFDKKQNNATSGGGVGYVDGSMPSDPGNSGILGSLNGLMVAATGALSGKTHIQFDGNIGAGGRADDIISKKSGLPSWALPAAIGGGLLLLLTSGGGRRR